MEGWWKSEKDQCCQQTRYLHMFGLLLIKLIPT